MALDILSTKRQDFGNLALSSGPFRSQALALLVGKGYGANQFVFKDRLFRRLPLQHTLPIAGCVFSFGSWSWPSTERADLVSHLKCARQRDFIQRLMIVIVHTARSCLFQFPR